MITKIYAYFGVVGILSILVWVTALVLLVISSRSRARSLYCFLALGVAAAGLMLAKMNSSIVSDIEMDRRDEMAAMAKARQASDAVEETGAAATLRFAEGDPEDTMKEYRKKGKQLRQNGKKPAGTGGRDSYVDEPEKKVKYLPEADLLAANRLDRINLLLVRLILWLAIGRVVVDYLKRFNSTVGGYWPLPIAGRWLDSLFEKTHAVLVRAPWSGSLTPRAYAERVVRKGESFIYFGESDPWPGQSWLPRMAVRRWSVWCLPKLDYGDPELSANGEFVLDAAWFNRCGVVVQGEDGYPLFEYIVELITLRHETGAVARKTVHLIWDLPQMPSEEVILPLVQMARATNIKLTVWASTPVADELVELFEECPAVNSL